MTFRFSLARSVLRGSVCLILDEATSSLDSETEKALMDAANKAFQGRTVISIAVIIMKYVFLSTFTDSKRNLASSSYVIRFRSSYCNRRWQNC